MYFYHIYAVSGDYQFDGLIKCHLKVVTPYAYDDLRQQVAKQMPHKPEPKHVAICSLSFLHEGDETGETAPQ